MNPGIGDNIRPHMDSAIDARALRPINLTFISTHHQSIESGWVTVDPIGVLETRRGKGVGV